MNPDPEHDQSVEQLAESLATKWSALRSRLVAKGFTRSEAMSILRMYVLSSSLSTDIFHMYPMFDPESQDDDDWENDF